MRRAKTVAQILESPYVNKKEIQMVLGVSQPISRKIFAFAKQLDEKELGEEWLIEGGKVRMKSVLKVYGIKMNDLIEMVKLNEERQNHSASAER